MTTELVERAEALAALDACVRHAAEHCGCIALVAGEAGIGKTSLLHAFTRAHPQVSLWWGACDALQTPHPLAPLHDIARSAAPRLRARLDGPRPALFDTVLDELRPCATPTIVIVEDAHWADDATLDLLKFLGRRIERTRALLVVSFRDDEVTATHPLRRVLGDLPGAATTRISLARLSSQGVAALAERAARPAQGLHALTQGNPFFVTELLRHEVDSVPPTVQALVLARLARLPPAAQAIVRLVSVVPAQIERALVEAVLAPAPADLDACLDSGLLVADAHSLAFRHELARQAIEASIAAPHAQRLHAQLLARLSSAPDGERVRLARLVHHAARAGDSAAVLRFAPEAARQAAAQGAHREAAAHWATALAHANGLDIQRRAELHDDHAYECYLIGAIEQAITAREAALSLWRRLGQPLKEGDTLRWLSRLHWFLGHKAQADAHANDAVRVLEALPSGPELAMAWSNKSQLHMLANEPAPATKWGRQAIALAERLGNDEILAHALNNVGTARLMAGEPDGAPMLERSLALSLQHGFEEHAARAYCNLSSQAVRVRDHAAAARTFEAGIPYCIDRDLDSWSLYLLAWRAQLRLEQGRWDEAASDAQAVLGRSGVPAISLIPAQAALGRLRARRGDPGVAELLDEALANALPTGELQRVAPVAAARAEAAWLAGDAARCAVEARRGFDLALQHDQPWALGETACWLWRCGVLRGAELDALIGRCAEPWALQMRRRWRDAAAAWAALDCPFEQALALADGDTDAQREALAICERLGALAAADALRRRLRDAGVRLPRGPRASTREHPFGLTTRELQVLELLCAGLRNAEIAQRLHRSVRTVDHHLEAVFAKLGVDSRLAALQAAQRAGLAPQSGQAAPTK